MRRALSLQQRGPRIGSIAWRLAAFALLAFGHACGAPDQRPAVEADETADDQADEDDGDESGDDNAGNTGGAGGGAGTGGGPAGAGGNAPVDAATGPDPRPDAGAAGTGGNPPTPDAAPMSGAGGNAPTGRLFGSHSHTYAMGTLRPTGDRAALDAAVAAFYDKWKAAYVTKGCDGYHLKAPGGTGPSTRVTNSQAHGLGMLTTVIMAGHDPEARAIFDGMVAVFKKVGSNLESATRPGNAQLMGYGINASCGGLADGDSQTDGDLPIAYALLLADKQWGSGGAVNYLMQAKATIDAIKKYEMNARSKAPLLGDWCSLPGEPAVYQSATHPSDFAFDQFRAFHKATGDMFWKEAVDAVYTIATSFQMRGSPMTGLFPEYMLNTIGMTSAAAAGFLGEPNAGAFTPDAALSVFQLANDYAINGATDPRGKDALAKVNAWIKMATGGDPTKVGKGYRLNGMALAAGPGPEFEAVFAAAAIVDPGSQAWLDALWTRMSAPTMTAYFSDTVRMLSLILVSGNWWAP